VTGTDLIYSTYLRNKNSILTGQEQGIGIAIDSTGRAYVAGVTLSDQFPTTEGAFQKDWSALGGARSAGFLAVIDPSMSGEESLVYSSYLAAIGGSFTSANSVAVDSSGKAYVVGSTFGGSFPITGDTFQTDPFLNNEVFALKIDPLKFGQSSLLYATLLGGEGSDYANGVAVDASGNAYIVGLTTSRFLPTVGGFQTSYSGDVDAFIAKLNVSGSDLLFSTYLGGDSADVAQAVTTDSAGAAYVVGTTESLNFPVRNPLQPNHSGLFFGDAFVVKIDVAGSLVYSTFLGGIGDDAGNAITVDATGSAYVVGTAGATDFPRTNNAIQSGKLGVRDAFFAKISSPPVAAPLAIVSAAVTDGQLLVFGEGFDDNSRIMIDSEEHNAATKRGKMDTVLVSKRAGKKIKPGQTVTLMVKSSLGAISPAFKFTRPIR
jgi:hypothetical protein